MKRVNWEHPKNRSRQYVSKWGDGRRKWETKYFMGMLTAFNSVRYRLILRRPFPSLRVCTDEGSSYGDVITKISRLDGYQISLPMVLRWCASRAEGPLQMKGLVPKGTVVPRWW